MNINKVTLSGNLTRDPELKVTPGGIQVLRFGLAVNDRARNQQTGEWEDVPNFFNCVVFGTRGESLAKILSKGSHVAVEGKLRYRAWDAKDGTRRSAVEVIVNDVDFLSRRDSAASFDDEAHGTQTAAIAGDVAEQDIPF